MEIAEIIGPCDSKVIRTIRYLWEALTSPKKLKENFLVPKEADDWKIMGLTPFTPHIEINGQWMFFSDNAQSKLRKMANLVCGINNIKSNNSYNAVYKQIKDSLQRTIQSLVNDRTKIEYDTYITKLLNEIIALRHNFICLRLIDGLDLNDTDPLRIGDATITFFNQAAFDELMSRYNDKEDIQIIGFKRFIENNFLNNLCIRTEIYGDETYAKKMSLIKSREIINILRFLFCSQYCAYVFDNIAKINLRSESINFSENSCLINVDQNDFIYEHDRHMRSLENFRLSREMLDDLMRYGFLNDIGYILISKNQTELDRAIMTSIYWIGEAQNEFFPHDAFIKYWIAIEALMSNQTEQKVTEGICDGIASLLTSCFVPYYDYTAVRRNMKLLYRKRCDIVHKGIHGHIGYNELTKICEYAINTVNRCCFLRRCGSTTLDDVKMHCESVYRSRTRYLKD